MKRRIHVWDLPKNKIYVQFNEDFRKNLFNLAIKEFGSFVKLGKFLNVKRADTTIATNWRNGTNCCPLDLMIKLANKISVPLKELEKNIKEVRYKSNIHKRGGNSGKPIINPKLPIVIDDNFAEILGHICGDGTISRSNIKKGIYLKYINLKSAIISIKRISKPGLRIYVKRDKIPFVLRGKGMAVISTPKGVLSDGEARKQGMGGEVIAYVW